MRKLLFLTDEFRNLCRDLYDEGSKVILSVKEDDVTREKVFSRLDRGFFCFFDGKFIMFLKKL